MVKDKEYFRMYLKNKATVTKALTKDLGTINNDEILSKYLNKDQLLFEFSLAKSFLKDDKLHLNKNLSSIKKIWYDYQYNDKGWPLFSEKLKLIIESHLTGQEGIEWLKAKVNSSKEQRIYFIPKFTKKIDLLDMSKTTFVPGTDFVRKPYFLKSKIQPYSLFCRITYTWPISYLLYISEEIKELIIEAGMTEILFKQAHTS